MVEGGAAAGLPFPGENPINPVTARQLNRAVTAAEDLAGVPKRVSSYTLRTAFSRPTCSNRASTSRHPGRCWGHAKLETEPRSTPASPSIRSATSRARWTGWASADEENAARLTTAAWRGLPSRSPTSFAPMGRHGGRPTLVTRASPSRRSCRRSRPVAQPRSAATSSAARTARTSASHTTPAGIVTARSARRAAARQWLEDREAELLPVPYYHVVFTLPAAIGAVAFQNKAAVYDLLFRTAAETLTTIAADPSISARASASPPYCTPGARR